MKSKINYLIVLISIFTIFLAACSDDSDASSGSGEASDYPSRNIEVLVGHGAGGGTDLFARAVVNELEGILDVNINVVNQEGGAGVVALQNAYNAPADGYTLIADAAYSITTAAGTNQHGLDDFIPIARFQNDTYALWVNAEDFSSIDEFMKAVEENPGEVTVGGTGSLGMDEMTVFMLEQEADIDLNFVPMEGAGEMHAGVLGGHLDAMVDEFGPTKSLADDGSIIPLAVFSEERIDEFPDVPTTVELGWDLTDGNERAFYVKRDTDPEIIEILESAMEEAYESEDYKKYEEDNYLHLRDGWLNSDDFEERTEELIEKYEVIMSELQQ
ncbi:tripartite tricarboxylate transporter substrate binding protein [Oceanobacillus sp. FSL W7-1293]|uniref:tripartite tricarboxylate transporter substrate binding protein n=1 Tax=Oceanobacillus TaxID=182709 RepID=UPI0030CC604B